MRSSSEESHSGVLVSWLRDGRRLPGEGGERVQDEAGRHLLLVRPETHNTSFTCVAKNAAGVTEDTLVVSELDCDEEQKEEEISFALRGRLATGVICQDQLTYYSYDETEDTTLRATTATVEDGETGTDTDKDEKTGNSHSTKSDETDSSIEDEDVAKDTWEDLFEGDDFFSNEDAISKAKDTTESTKITIPITTFGVETRAKVIETFFEGEEFFKDDKSFEVYDEDVDPVEEKFDDAKLPRIQTEPRRQCSGSSQQRGSVLATVLASVLAVLSSVPNFN